MTFDAVSRPGPDGTSRGGRPAAAPTAFAQPVAARDVKPAVVPGHSFRIVARGADTAGAYSLTEATSPLGAGVPAHAHDNAVECFYVLDGQYRLTVSGRTDEVGAGGFALVPRGASHRFEVVDGEARAVVLFAPAGFEEVFRRMPEIFGTPGEPGPLWQRLNGEFSTRLLPEPQPLPGPRALVSPGPGPIRAESATILASASATHTGLTIALRSDPHPGSAWILPSPVSAVWVVSGGYRFESPSGPTDVFEGQYAWLHEAPPRQAISLHRGSRALYLVSQGSSAGPAAEAGNRQ